MKHHIEKNLHELDDLLQQMTNQTYSQKLQVLSGASVGEHVRHILELYLCLFHGVEKDSVCYDNREREDLLGRDVNHARQVIRWIIARLQCIPGDKAMTLWSDFSSSENVPVSIKTSLSRELAYNLEHSIHHQALIRIGIAQLNFPLQVDDNFGVAPATIRYRTKSCVQ